jgi:hypothetical protein
MTPTAHTLRGWPSNYTDNKATASASFTVEIVRCTLTASTINDMIVHVGEQLNQVVTIFTEPIPALDYLAPCGSHVYELVGGNTSCVTFVPATRTLTVNTSLHSDV